MEAARNNVTLAKWIMVIATLLAPFGVYFFSLRNSVTTVSVHAILWGIMPEQVDSSEFLHFYSYIIIGRGLFYGIFNIWFGLEVIRYFKDYTRKHLAILAGVLSLMYPIVLAALSWSWIRESENFIYIGPIPLQFIIGILLMKYFGESEHLTPWDDDHRPGNEDPWLT